ncbi:alpha/beta hydrolase [Panacibacter sp. DH6]|uniref:Alpha/beta hydrolase n=1 Tax=Panacibacter microcysteis TaxID=2793269 RepID=A0A931E3B9_9BACT|nr:alpha/beta hydrolase [Panacibacter microcysteis]MBG9377827.1 alpha/beta hydrolase [Panacibacter microcysteis]
MTTQIKLTCAVILFIAAACASPESPDKHVEVKNGIVPIAYNMSGSGDTALVFVHGWGINKDYWSAQEKAFNNRYKVVAIDLGGHGESGKQRNHWTIGDFANDVLAVLDSLNLNRVILVGHSMSGDVILDVAYKIPERIVGFIGIDNFKEIGVAMTPEQLLQVAGFMKALDTNYRKVAGEYSRMSLFPKDYKDSASINRVINDITNTDSVVAAKSLQGLMDFAPNETALLKQINIPVHLIVSDYTPTITDSLAKYSKAGYSVKTITGVGHYPMIEKPGEFNKALAETLNEIANGK